MTHTTPFDYAQIAEKTAHLGGQDVRYVTKPGLPAWESVSFAAALLAEHASLPEPGKGLWLGCGHGAAAAALALRFPAAQLVLMDDSCIAAQMAVRTMLANLVENAHVMEQISVLPEGQAAFDVVIIDLPKGRRLAQHWLAEAWYALRSGGWLFLAGANDQGIQSVVKDASQLFGPGGVLDYRKGNRVVKWVKGEAAAVCEWIRLPGIAPGTWQRLEIETRLGKFELVSLPGVFSYDRLDEGTALLLDAMQVKPGERVLDLGCGYGIIGIAAAMMGAAQVDLVDSSLLAIASAQANLAAHNLTHARAIASDGLSAVQDRRYDRILSNPPFHAGKGVDYQMAEAFIQQSWQALEAGGTLALVANTFIHYEGVMEKYFRRVSVLAETGKYKVLAGRK